MKVIFITIAYPRSSGDSNLYSDLMTEFAEHGHEVFVVCSIEKRFGSETALTLENGINVLRVRTGDITSNPNYIAKGLALLRLQSQFIAAIRKYLPGRDFDLILFSTPPIQYNRIIRYLKKKSGATSYLMLKDIFPQNAIDVGLLSKWHPAYWYFKQKERSTYLLSDTIGCMSPANVEYLLKHNPYLLRSDLEICANSFRNRGTVTEEERAVIRSGVRQAYGIAEQDLLMVYGGNLGVPQGLNFLVEILRTYREEPGTRFMIIGDGTWYGRVEQVIREGNIRNVILRNRLPRDEFKKVLTAADLGLIFLHPAFTIPNFPSRLLDYLECKLPVIAATDPNTDVGKVLEDNQCGYGLLNGDLERFRETVLELRNDVGLRKRLGENARILFEKEYLSKKTYETIIARTKRL